MRKFLLTILAVLTLFMATGCRSADENDTPQINSAAETHPNSNPAKRFMGD